MTCYTEVIQWLCLTGVDENVGHNNQLERVIKTYLKTLGQILDMDEDEEDLNNKKLMSALIAGVSIVCMQLPVTGNCVVKVCVVFDGNSLSWHSGLHL